MDLRNEGTKAVFYCANPQQLNGQYGPYVSVDEIDKSVVKIEWRVFAPKTSHYSDETAVELRTLGAGESISETVVIKWPLSETVPPVDFHFERKLIKRKNVNHFRLTMGYFEENDGIKQLLTRKRSGRVNGIVEITPGHGKRFYEIQRLVSADVTVPELAGR